ncbi:hypothetical protein FRC08_004441 [Ceratobasidium sp. 394]|nr:hypothetical protein FRC08_004441 [Ceratobasidium sp. 394]
MRRETRMSVRVIARSERNVNASTPRIFCPRFGQPNVKLSRLASPSRDDITSRVIRECRDQKHLALASRSWEAMQEAAILPPTHSRKSARYVQTVISRQPCG